MTVTVYGIGRDSTEHHVDGFVVRVVAGAAGEGLRIGTHVGGVWPVGTSPFDAREGNWPVSEAAHRDVQPFSGRGGDTSPSNRDTLRWRRTRICRSTLGIGGRGLVLAVRDVDGKRVARTTTSDGDRSGVARATGRSTPVIRARCHARGTSTTPGEGHGTSVVGGGKAWLLGSAVRRHIQLV